MSTDRSLLIIDDEERLLDSLETFFMLRGCEVTICSDPNRAIATREECGAQTILLDIMMPNVDGLTLLKEFKSLSVPVDVIVMTGLASASHVYDAWVCGAFDFVLKPFSSVNDVETAVVRAWERQDRWREVGSEAKSVS